MRAKPFLASLLILGIAATACLWSAEAPRFIHVERLDAAHLLPPPPLEGSREQAADLALAKLIISGRSQHDIAEAQREDDLTLFTFTEAVGPWFVRGACPKTQALFEQIEKDARAAAYGLKDTWKRPRPFMVDSSIQPLESERSYSYPSGHSTRGTVYAYVLAELVPSRKTWILEQGRAAGWNRILVGMHYPTDIYAGRVLGQAIFNELMRNEAFRDALDECRKELAALQVAEPVLAGR